MSAYPPPPPAYAPPRTRPSVVTKNATILFIIGIVCVVVAVLEFIFIVQPWGYVSGALTVVLGALSIICALGLFAAQSWALRLSGLSNKAWAMAPDVREYFGLAPASPAYPSGAPAPPPAPATPACPTCGRPLTYVQQYQRWYCQNCRKYA